MFTYYQESPNAKWAYVVESEEALTRLRENNTPMQSVLSVKEPIDDEEDKHGKTYRGPFYVDIDVDGDPKQAIASAQKFADKLEDCGVYVYQVYLSGKKGFHFLIPMKVFADGRPVKSLPLIYREMALDMYVEGIDLSVYNEGRPRLLRTVNVKRKDNGKYKVQISKEELYSLTPEKYSKLTEAARPELSTEEPKLSLKMEAVYATSKIVMQKKQRALSELEFVPDVELAKTVSEEGALPKCISLLIEQGDTKAGSTFNQACIQFAAFMVRAGVKDWMKHAKTMAYNVKSSSYNSEMARFSELKKMVNYVASSKNYGFSKAMLFSVMEPCRDCAICNGTIEDGEAVPEDHEEYSDITETPHGYITGQGKNQRRLTTFTLDIISKFSRPATDENESDTRVGSHAIVKVNGHKRDRLTLMEEVWNSSRDFKQATKGKSNFAFYGNDIDLQKLKNKLFADEENMTDITYVHTVGIHRHKIGPRTILVYVEPGFSLSSIKEKNTHQIWGSLPAPPNIQSASYPEPTDDLKELIDRLLKCNDPVVTSTMVGWLSLCHIKVQLTMRDNQFPLLNLWGNSGSGKSALSSLFAYLHGIDYMLEQSPMSLQGTTPWAVAQYCTTSESTVRLVEEFNRGEIQATKYDQFTGMFKAAWNKQTFAKGGVDKMNLDGKNVSGVKVLENPISAPLCIMSEQSPERPALRQRMVQLNINRAGRELPGAAENFYYAVDRKHLLTGLARALVFSSLGTHPEWVAEAMESFKAVVPKEIDERPRFSYRGVLTGIKFFGKTLSDIGLDQEYVDEKVQFMSDSVLGNLMGSLDDIRIEKLRTEVSLVVSEMAIMADAYEQGMDFTLIPRQHYIVDQAYLYLDITVCHMLYTRWARTAGGRVIISSLQQFETLLSQEDFFDSYCTRPEIGDSLRKLGKLEISKMAERGIDVSMFKGFTL